MRVPKIWHSTFGVYTGYEMFDPVYLRSIASCSENAFGKEVAEGRMMIEGL